LIGADRPVCRNHTGAGRESCAGTAASPTMFRYA
jgi:hypothetical protein